jgi:hypothetical protein
MSPISLLQSDFLVGVAIAAVCFMMSRASFLALRILAWIAGGFFVIRFFHKSLLNLYASAGGGAPADIPTILAPAVVGIAILVSVSYGTATRT